MAAAPAGIGAAGTVRRVAVPLRHPPPVVPEKPDAAVRRPITGHRTERAGRVCRRRSRGRTAAHLRKSACRFGRVQHDLSGSEGHVTLVEQFQFGLDAPICLTWELTYACNLSCVHCLSSSGRRDPRELTTAECQAVIDELQRMQVFYVNIGGGEPTVRPDFWALVDYATGHDVGVKFSTNGVKITPHIARRLAGRDYVDVLFFNDTATAEVNDAVRGRGSF